MRLLVLLLPLLLLLESLSADSTTVFNELYYHPFDDSESEWVELANVMSVDMDLSGWRLAGGISYTFPEGTIIRAGGYLLVAADPGAVRNPPLFDTVLGPYEGRLANDGEEIELYNLANRLMSSVEYGDREPWPVAADGAGASLAKRRPDIDSADVASWTASRQIGGTPGRRNFSENVDLGDTVKINEVSAAADSSDFWIELSAREGVTVDPEGYVVGIENDPERQAMISGESIVEGGYTVIRGTQLGFGAERGERLGIYSADKRQVLDVVLVDEVVRGRSDEHPDRWLYPSSETPGEVNDIPLQDAIVINEIMYRAFPLPAHPGEPAIFDSIELAGPESTDWRVWQGGNLSGEAWRLSDFDDSKWIEGGPVFAGGDVMLPAQSDVSTTLSIGRTAYYFRLTFTLDALPEEDELLRLRYLVDDGAAFYLNGTELARVNLPSGVLSGGTLSSETVGNPVWSEAIELPTQALRQGVNQLAVEVHQSSFLDTDLAFSAELSLSREIAPALAPQPFRDSPEEWLELYNRSEETVDLSGWTLNEGIRFEFPEGAALASGEYLVVSNDGVTLGEKYSALADRIYGNFDGQLSNSGENILLRDGRGNPADEVRYFDGGRWPGYADGRGSSMELRDPHADNSIAEAWAASDETGKAEWQQIEYRMVSGQSFGLDTWNELNLGMLSAGEVLIDDVEVIRDPDGVRRNLIQNGTFQGTLFEPDNLTRKWRFVGNHRLSHAASDPDDEGNTVLHLVSSGPTDTKHNQVETTFRENEPLMDGEEYEVRLRARWVGGSNLLNIRSYYSRLARTFALPVPEMLGTPGAPNSQWEDNIGPTFDEFRHHPILPEPNQPVTVSVKATDPDGVESMTLFYAADGEVFASVPMEESPEGYQAAIPGMSAGTVVQFYVQGTDGAGEVATFPQAGPNSRALFIVDDGRGTNLPVEEIRLIMMDADFDFLLDRLNLVSDERISCTVIVGNRNVIYNTGVRLKGSPAGRARDGALYRGFNIAFPPEQLYRGIHDSVSLDRSGRAPRAGGQDEIYIKHLFNSAGIPFMFDDLVYVVAPDATHSGTSLASMARYGGLFTETQFEDGDLGSIFNLEITYDPTQTVDGNRESYKVPVPFTHIGTDFRDLGDDKEQYRWPLELRTGRRADDYIGLIRFCQTMALPTDQLAEQIDEVMDVDTWMRTAAMHNLCAIGDTWWNGGLQHNIRLYVPWDGRGVVGLPWDLDFLFTGTNGPLKSTSGNLRRVMDIPKNTRLYYGHLHDLIETVFTPEYMQRWLDHYGTVVGQSYSSQSNFIRSRSAFVRSRLEEAVPQLPFEITTSGGQAFTVDATKVSLRGRGWINIREFRLVGHDEPLAAEWIDEQTWEVVLPLVSGENIFQLEAYDFSGERVGTDSIAVTSTASEPTALEYLRITEIHYHPAEPVGAEQEVSTDKNAFEFIELQNIGERELDLSGVAFTDGIDFVFPEGTLLPGGAFIVVAKNADAFAARYGASLSVAGEYEPGNLANDGERIELRDKDGYPILSFSYDDAWHPASDGDGFSLTIVDSGLERDAWALSDSWTTSGSVHGTPGRAADNNNTVTYEVWAAEHLSAVADVSGPTFDADLDGVINLLEYAFGLNPLKMDDVEWRPKVSREGGGVTIQYRRIQDSEDISYEVQASDDLIDWTAPELEVLQVSPIDERVELITVRDSNPSTTMRYVRIKVSK